MKSFIQYNSDSHFPIENLPYGIFKPKPESTPRAGTAIGDYILDLSVLEEHGFFSSTSLGKRKIFSNDSLNEFMSLGRTIWKEVRAVLQDVLSYDNPILRNNEQLKQKAFIKMSNAIMCMPVEIGDYTDFYSSREHATNVGIMFRGKENALMPNWLHLPVGYHGRTSSIVLSGTDIHRPKGQSKAENENTPRYGPSKQLDFELEMGFFVSNGNKLGKPIPIDEANNYIFGLVLVNDWSARDIQKWEYQPLGPFLAKNFGTSISPWVVTLEALEPFRCSAPEQDPEPLPYLQSKNRFTYDINLKVLLTTEKQKEPFLISKTNFRHLYWTVEQQLAHHTITGCNMKTGDLCASGTISGPSEDSYGSLLELTWRGEKPIKLPSGEERKFLEDGDEVIMMGYCQGNGYCIGFGEVKGKILSALEL